MTLSRSRVSEVVATYPTDDSFKVTFRHHHCHHHHHHHHHHRYHHHRPPPFPLTRSAQSSPLTLMQASRKLCELIKAGVAGIFGPVSPVSSNHVQSVRSVNWAFLFVSTPSVQVTDTLHLPFMETRWEYNFKPSAFSISIHPHPSMLGQAFADFIRLGMMLVLLLICCSGMWAGRA